MSRNCVVPLFFVALLFVPQDHAAAQLFRTGASQVRQDCRDGICRQQDSKKKDVPNSEATTKEDETQNAKSDEIVHEEKPELLSVARERFFAPSVEVADACDEILDRLEARYGVPNVWEPFPVYFQTYRGDGIAGYTSYVAPRVAKVVVFESLEKAKGGTLDHELTHAYFFYVLNSNCDLFLNEGFAQNSEYRRRESLRQTVYRRYNNGEFVDINRLYGRYAYDGSLLLYHEGFSVVDFLIARGGSRWIVAFMDDLTKNNDINASLRRFYGYQNIEELQDAWTRFIQEGQDRQSVQAVQ